MYDEMCQTKSKTFYELNYLILSEKYLIKKMN